MKHLYNIKYSIKIVVCLPLHVINGKKHKNRLT